MGRRERGRCTDEFKAEVVGLVRSGRTVAEVSRDFDLTAGGVRIWVQRREGRRALSSYSSSLAARRVSSRVSRTVPPQRSASMDDRYLRTLGWRPRPEAPLSQLPELVA